MPRPSCEVCCRPPQMFRGNLQFQSSVGVVLCELLAAVQALDPEGPGVRYDWEMMCEPGEEPDLPPTPIFIRFEYNPSTGEITSVEAFTATGTPYGGAIGDLVPCDCACAQDLGPEAVQIVSREVEPFFDIELDEAGVVIRNSPGFLQFFHVANPSPDTAAYAKLYDKATAPDPSTDTPVHIFFIPANLPHGFVLVDFAEFGAGISALATLLAAVDDDTPPDVPLILNARHADNG